MNAAVPPHAADDAEPTGVGGSGVDGRTEPSFDFVLQVLENSRNADDHGNTVVMDHLHQPARMSFGRESGRAFKEKRNEQPLGLSEHMAQRKQVENSNGLDQTSPLLIFRDFFGKGTEVGTDVAVAVDHTFW